MAFGFYEKKTFEIITEISGRNSGDSLMKIKNKKPLDSVGASEKNREVASMPNLLASGDMLENSCMHKWKNS